MRAPTPPITVRLSQRHLRLLQSAALLPPLLLALVALAWVFTRDVPPTSRGVANEMAVPADRAEAAALLGYPASGADLDPASYIVRLPPPPLDAIAYDIREPLRNGDAVPVKKRWLWLPEGTAITVTRGPDGTPVVTVPEGATWWKEFYVETDRAAFLIERRIILRVPVSADHPDGWAYYSAHHTPSSAGASARLVVPSVGPEADAFTFEPNEWLPTQPTANSLEVRFVAAGGTQYGYVFPGGAQCTACHNGATGAYPNPADDPIRVFGLHPNNLTPASYTAVVARGWLRGGDALLAPTPTAATSDTDVLTAQVVAVMRNNCASCHNASPNALASYSAFVVDPNHAYTTDELVALLAVRGRMHPSAYPLVTPGQPEQSELWIRLNGHYGRRRMPPAEGGLPDPDPAMLDLWRAWILAVQ